MMADDEWKKVEGTMNITNNKTGETEKHGSSERYYKIEGGKVVVWDHGNTTIVGSDQTVKFGSPPSGCYITSACTETANLPDTCLELTILRNFRDTYVRQLPNGEELIASYYTLAPPIVASIKNSPQSAEIFKRLYEDEVLPIVALIQSGDHAAALERYVLMTKKLEQDYLVAK